MSKNKEKKKYTRYTRGHLTFRNIRFWIFWLVIVGLIVWGFTKVHAYFEKNLIAYENAQYSYVAQDMFKIFEEKRFDELFEYESCDVPYMESKGDYIAYLANLTNGREIGYTQIGSENSDEVRYVVTADDKAFAQFTLKKTGETASFEVIPLIGYTVGVDLYEPGDIIMNTLQPVTYDYKIPSYATITVNGKELGEEYKVGEETLFFEGHLPKNSKAESYRLVSYRFTCALGEPQVEVLDAESNPVELKPMGNDTYFFEFPYDDDELKSKCEGKALDFIKTWCLFSTHNTNKANVLNMTLKGSTAYEFITNYEATWITTADKYNFGDYSSKNYAWLGDDVITCEINIIYNTTSKHVDNTYDTKCRLYFIKSGNDWKVYDFELM